MTIKNSGFTLTELVITIAIISIVLAIVAPNFRDSIQNNRLQTQAAELVNAFALTRNEAIKRNQTISITAKTGGWKNGWEIKESSTILRERGVTKGNNNITLPSSATSYQFNNRGIKTAGAAGDAVLCDTRGIGISLSITTIGQVYLRNDFHSCSY